MTHNCTGRVLVGVDGSSGSLEALRTAIHLASSRNMRLDAVTAWSSGSWLISDTDYDWEPELVAFRTATDCARHVFGGQWPEWFNIGVYQGSPESVLIDQSKSADLLVVGENHQSRLLRLLLGSVSAACRKRAHCPVVVAPRSAVGF